MKRILITAIVISILFATTACGNDSDDPDIKIPLYSFEEETDIFVVDAVSDDTYIEVLKLIAENDWYLIDVSTSFSTGYHITYSKTPIFSQCPYCSATLDQIN